MELSRKKQFKLTKSKALNMLKVLVMLSIVLTVGYCNDSYCPSDHTQSSPEYHLMEKCHRSRLGVAAKANFSSLTSCKKLGVEKKALALNFSPLEALKELSGDGNETVGYTCEVLKCTETNGGLSLTEDIRYDHYSIYAHPLPNLNSTCVPGIGMFFLLKKNLNYTEATIECRNMSGMLADVTSEQRTDSLALLLSGAGVSQAFVAMRSINGSTFRGVNGDALGCTTYRAWAPGHPRRYRHLYDCVLITNQRTWLTVPCKKRFPSLCELTPGGPYNRGSIFESRFNNKTIENGNFTA